MLLGPLLLLVLPLGLPPLLLLLLLLPLGLLPLPCPLGSKRRCRTGPGCRHATASCSRTAWWWPLLPLLLMLLLLPAGPATSSCKPLDVTCTCASGQAGEAAQVRQRHAYKHV